jgi:hypothetical protein
MHLQRETRDERCNERRATAPRVRSLQREANPHAVRADGALALHLAEEYGHVGVVHILKSLGAFGDNDPDDPFRYPDLKPGRDFGAKRSIGYRRRPKSGALSTATRVLNRLGAQ